MPDNRLFQAMAAQGKPWMNDPETQAFLERQGTVPQLPPSPPQNAAMPPAPTMDVPPAPTPNVNPQLGTASPLAKAIFSKAFNK